MTDRAPHRLALLDDPAARVLGPLPDEVTVGADPSCGVVLHPRVAAPPVAAVLRRDGPDTWRLSLPGALPHPCRIVRGAARRPAASGDVLRVGDVLELTGPDADVRLALRDDVPAAPDAPGAPPRPAAPALPAWLGRDALMIGMGLLAVIFAGVALLLVNRLLHP